MPYQSIRSLPESVKHSLPKHAQEIYKEAFNGAWDTYADPNERRADDDRETVAHKVAWAAVKKSYKKTAQGKWIQTH